MDFIYIGIGVAFFLLSWGLIRLCDTLGTDERGEQS
jgi:hypothetical protein